MGEAIVLKQCSKRHLIEETRETLPLEITSFPEQYQANCEIEFYGKQENKQAHIQELKDLLKAEKITKHIEFKDDYLQQFLWDRKYDTTDAFVKIKNFINLRRNHGWLFQSFRADLTKNVSSRYACVLPYRCPEGYSIVLLQLGKWDPEELTFEDFGRICFIMHLQLIRYPLSQITGVKVIIDCKNTGWRHLKYCTLQNVLLLYHVAIECVPINFSDIHVINQNFVVDLLYRMGKSVLPDFVTKLFIFHSSIEELLNYFPSSIIPREYGGELDKYYMLQWLTNACEQHKIFPEGGQSNIS